MSGLGIEFSSTCIRASYEKSSVIHSVLLGFVATNPKLGFFPLFYYHDSKLDNQDPFLNLESEPECIITNVLQALELLDMEDRDSRAKELEWTCPIQFKDDCVYYQIGKNETLYSITDILRSFFSDIMGRYGKENASYKAAIAVPCSFGDRACEIIRSATHILGTVEVIKQNEAILYGSSTEGKILAIGCNEYISNVSIVEKQVLWSENFEDYNLPKHIYDFLLDKVSSEELSASQRGILYVLSRQCAQHIMNGELRYTVPSRIFGNTALSTEQITQFIDAKKDGFVAQLLSTLSDVDLSDVSSVVVYGEYSPILVSSIKEALATRLPSQVHVESSLSILIQGAIKKSISLVPQIGGTVIIPPRSNILRSKGSYYVWKQNDVHCVIPKGTPLPVRINDRPLCFLFDSKAKYVYFFRDGKQLTKYLLVRSNMRPKPTINDVVVMYPMLDESENFSAAFFWKDTHKVVHTIDFGIQYDTPTFELEDDTVYILCPVC